MTTTSTGAVCIVTGASRGIGAATAELAARAGYAVVINYLKNEKGANAVAKKIESAGGVGMPVRADVGDSDAVSRLFEVTVDQLGPPTLLVNNAAESGPRLGIEKITPEIFWPVLTTTLAGPILCIAEAARCMPSKHGGSGGAIINVSSQAAITGGRLLTPYVAAKAGLEAITIGLARELGPLGIRVNAVRPGLIGATSRKSNVDLSANDRVNEVPLGRLGRAEEVARTIMWLASPAASYVSGAVLSVTGGR